MMGNTAKMNTTKAITSRMYNVERETLEALGIINKAGKRKLYKERGQKRHLYQGHHEVPVFNLKQQDEPVMLSFRFACYRTSVKIYVEAKLVVTQPP